METLEDEKKKKKTQSIHRREQTKQGSSMSIKLKGEAK